MRVAFVTGEFPLVSQTFIFNQLAGLIERGVEVTVFSLWGSPREDGVEQAVVQDYELVERTRYAPQVPRSLGARLSSGSRCIAKVFRQNPPAVVRLLNPLRFGRRALSLRLLHEAVPLLPRQDYDIVHCQFGDLALSALALRDAGLFKGRIVTHFRGYDISQFVKTAGPQVYADLFARGEFFLTNCDFFRHRVIELGCAPERIAVLRSGIDVGHFAFAPPPPPSDGVFRIAFVGRLVGKKGVEYAVRAIAKLRSAGREVELDIVGDGPLRASLEALIDELELRPWVHLHGAQDHDGVLGTLAAAHVLAAPSVTAADGDQDASVNTLKEAMAMGLPVVATRHGGIPELVEDGVSGFLVPERDSGALADAIARMCDSPDLWQTFGLTGRRRVEAEYDMHRLNDRLLDVYRQVASGNREAAAWTGRPVIVPSQARL
ncbi:glycosyltransferase [Algihabitans albus]|uniref:glycosyltransferase n=1 Tax=Algihabitans albus TaxID=2164067 RepID=UPI000E5CC5E5|nr:glycosyltransferase [Algihabitans albus]